MKQNIFETRQRAQDLLDEAINIWRQGPFSERLEGLEKDPVMSLLMSAIAYQANETDSDIELLKDELLSEFVHTLTPYEMGHAIPATAIIETALKDDVSEWEVNSESTFQLAGTDFQFIPILRTKVFNAVVSSIVRMDGRRWKVTLDFSSPVSDLSGFTFCINNKFFEDVKVSYKGHLLPLVKPWHYSKMPLSKSFSTDTMLYNSTSVYDASMMAMELFARQNVRLFCIKEHNPEPFLKTEVDTLDLIFEFSGITDQFTFDKQQLSLNCILLAEAQQESVTLSAAHPITRVAGHDEASGSATASQQFLHLIRPADEQIYGKARVEARRLAADRFNQGSLIRLLNALINKYHSDFYAFQHLKELTDDETMRSLQTILQRMIKACQSDLSGNFQGTYLLLRPDELEKDRNVSLSVNYLTTHGALVNDVLGESSTFTPPAIFVGSACRQIAAPVPGADEVSDKLCEEGLLRYHVITNDRIVTPADIKAFCQKELTTRYGFDRTMIRNIDVSHRLELEPSGCGYEIVAEIRLSNNNFVKRSFADKIPQVEILLQKMMEVRSTCIYPIRVSISIDEQ